MSPQTILARCARRLLALLLIGLLPACVPLLQAPGQAPMPQGWLGKITSIEGRNAFVDSANGGAGQRAYVGQALLAGDRVRTGPGTRLKVAFARGGYMELDENTDPGLFQDLRCLVISLFASGRIFVDASGACVESLGTRSQQFSKAVYAVMPAGPYVQITVADGQVRTLQPPGATAPKGWRIDMNRRAVLGGGHAYRVSDDALREAIGWTQYWRNRYRDTSDSDFPIFRRSRSHNSSSSHGDSSSRDQQPSHDRSHDQPKKDPARTY